MCTQNHPAAHCLWWQKFNRFQSYLHSDFYLHIELPISKLDCNLSRKKIKWLKFLLHTLRNRNGKIHSFEHLIDGFRTIWIYFWCWIQVLKHATTAIVNLSTELLTNDGQSKCMTKTALSTKKFGVRLP